MGAIPVLKYPGAKWRVADWIVSHMPPHVSYLEPFFGGGAVLFSKKPSHTETINDIDSNVVNFFKILREKPDELARVVRFTPWSREEYKSILTTDTGYFAKIGDPLEDARRLAVRMWQARGVRTRGKCQSWRHDIQGRQGSNCPKEWNRLPEAILAAAERLKEVQIENQDALKLIQRHAFPGVLIYADPPYVLETRNKNKIYQHEFTDDDHIKLLDILDDHPGPVLLSGYSCALYDGRLKRWQRKTRMTHAEGGLKREEVLWLNPIAARHNEQLKLFG